MALGKKYIWFTLSLLLGLAADAEAQHQARMVPPLELSLETTPALRFFPIDSEAVSSRIDGYGNGQLFINLQVSNAEPASRGRLVIQVLRKDGGVVASTSRSLELNQGETRVGSRLYISPADVNSGLDYNIQFQIYGRDRKLADTQTIPFRIQQESP